MRIALDAMGGDLAPKAQVIAAQKAIQAFNDIEVTLVGHKDEINKYVTNQEKITILHTNEKIEDTDQPTIAVRRKKNSSMVLAMREVKEGRAEAAISAGNTGALMTAGLLYIGRIQGIDRPALSPMLPTMNGKGFLLLDAGANMDSKPSQLLQYAIMGDAYMQMVVKIKQPRIGLLNVGTESGKGNELTKEAFPLLESANFKFIGNVEARDLLNGVADVVVCDGFAGNIVLKSIEGTAGTLFSLLKEELTKSFKNKLAAGVLKSDLHDLKSRMSYSEYGGAGLFGLKSPVIKAHGSSDETAVFHAIRQAREMVNQQVAEIIKNELTNLNLEE